MEGPPATSPRGYHVPWLVGLMLAPLLFGSVTGEGQAAVGFLCALSLFLLAADVGAVCQPLIPRGWRVVALAMLVVPLLPLPLGWVSLLSPWRAALARAFPLELGAPAGWLPLTTSPAGTVNRLWELGIVLTGFVLARHAARQPAFGRRLAGWLGTTVVLLVAGDAWYRLHPTQPILGLWRISWGTGAGTFANPNAFADWLCVASLFILGAVLRGLAPLRAARGGGLPPEPSSALTSLGLLGVAVAGFMMAIASGSRGAALALLAGVGVWLVALAKRSHRRQRWGLIAFGALAGFLVLLEVSGLLRHKVGQMDAATLRHYAKFHLWAQAVALWGKFPLFGIGWGAFVVTFNHFKLGWADVTCWHAENDYLQLLVEAGIVGATVCVAVLARLLHAGTRFVWRESSPEPELALGSVAALAAFAVHAGFEFVFQVTANAFLAAVLLGYLIGSRDTLHEPAAPPPPTRGRTLLNALWALALGGGALLQGLAFWHWHRAEQTPTAAAAVADLRQSLALWPWTVSRQIGLTRQEVLLADQATPLDRASLGRQCRTELNRTLARDPFNWELRLERVWLDFAFSPNATRTLAEAAEVALLNPQQPQIPLRFANYLATRQPAAARRFLQQTDRHDPAVLRTALALAWRLDQDTTRLWALTPASTAGLLTLGDFATGEGLFPMAAQAYLLLTNRLPTTELARKLLAAHDPAAALEQLANAQPSPATDALRCQALAAAVHLSELIGVVTGVAERRGSPVLRLPSTPSDQDLDALRTQWQAHPHDLERAQRLAAKIGTLPAAQRDLPQLRALVQTFPRDPLLVWWLFATERDLGQTREAAQTGSRWIELPH